MPAIRCDPIALTLILVIYQTRRVESNLQKTSNDHIKIIKLLKRQDEGGQFDKGYARAE